MRPDDRPTEPEPVSPRHAFRFGAGPQSPPIGYRAMVTMDAEWLAILESESNPTGPPWAEPPWTGADFRAALTRPDTIGLVASARRGLPVGYLVGRYVGRARDTLSVARILVHPERRRQGIAGHLLRLARTLPVPDPARGCELTRVTVMASIPEALTDVAHFLKAAGGTARLERIGADLPERYLFTFPPPPRQL